ncbi:MAG: RimK family alpha-L-glutamate ligase [Gilvibacter sp.]
MNIAILSRGEQLYSTQSLIRAAQARNHEVEVIDPVYCKLMIDQGKPRVVYKGELVNDLHAIIPRIGASNTYFGSSVVRQFEAMGVFSTVSSEAIITSRDKWTSFQLLSKAELAVPKTVLGNLKDPDALLEEFSDYPIIIKLLKGTHGQGVILSESRQNALATLETLNGLGSRYLLQEYIAEARGTDLRVIVVDGVIVAAMKRQSKADDFRSNLHRGGSSTNITLSYQEESLARRAAKVLKLGACGVDILQSERGPLVLEVNSTPGLEGIETTTGKNVARSIIGYIERNKK